MHADNAAEEYPMKKGFVLAVWSVFYAARIIMFYFQYDN